MITEERWKQILKSEPAGFNESELLEIAAVALWRLQYFDWSDVIKLRTIAAVWPHDNAETLAVPANKMAALLPPRWLIESYGKEYKPSIRQQRSKARASS